MDNQEMELRDFSNLKKEYNILEATKREYVYKEATVRELFEVRKFCGYWGGERGMLNDVP